MYIAPMKALAQEVVEKFSFKLKKCGIIVRELTGDIQLVVQRLTLLMFLLLRQRSGML